MAVDLSVELGPLRLASPVLAAAGTFGYGIEFADAVPLRRLGAIITKTITAQPRLGNPPPRLVETPSGMLNAVGLQNVGLEAFVREKLPALAELGPPIIVSLLAESPEDVQAMLARLEHPAVAAVELNLSCPNSKWKGSAGASTGGAAGSRMVAQDPEATAALVAAARASTRKPLIAKLSPDVTDLRPVALAAEAAGADVLSLVNTFTGMSLDPATRRSRLGSLTGGLSGPAVRPLAVYRVWAVRQAVRCPILGLGGIVRAEDAVEFFLAGANAVAVGTATFAEPRAAVRVIDGLARYLQAQGIGSIRELVGARRPGAPAPAAAVGAAG
jgi:dihydroorotate dehydrogenase (NAD+) catalytic subunit